MKIDFGNSVTPSDVITFAFQGSQKKSEKGAENLLEEIVAEKLLKSGEGNKNPDPEAQKAPNKINPGRSTPRYIVLKMAKSSDKDNFKSSKRKELQARETP